MTLKDLSIGSNHCRAEGEAQASLSPAVTDGTFRWTVGKGKALTAPHGHVGLRHTDGALCPTIAEHVHSAQTSGDCFAGQLTKLVFMDLRRLKPPPSVFYNYNGIIVESVAEKTKTFTNTGKLNNVHS